MRSYLPGILSALTALATNIVLDIYTDVPMLLRWAVAIICSLLVTFVLIKWAERRQKRKSNDAVSS